MQVFESVIAWIQHSVEARAQHLPSLMEHIRLPLLSQDYLIHKVVRLSHPGLSDYLSQDYLIHKVVRIKLPPQFQYWCEQVDSEPLLKQNDNCKDFIIEAMKYHLLKVSSLDNFTIHVSHILPCAFGFRGT